MDSLRWHRMRRGEHAACEAFLRRLEPCCTSACARFLGLKPGKDQVWYAAGTESGEPVSALLIRSRRSLLPVFNGQRLLPIPRFLNPLPGAPPLHSVQGLREDAELLEGVLAPVYTAIDRIDYHLMNLDGGPDPEALNGQLRLLRRRGPEGLNLRIPDMSDMEKLLPLQIAYEQEEVLPRGAVLNLSSIRLGLEHIVFREHILAAELRGRIVAKINTNALSFTRYQLGGVYVHPGYRGLGIATAMTAALVLELTAGGRGVSLFVKKRNAAAQTVYRRLGFRTIGDYRISYY